MEFRVLLKDVVGRTSAAWVPSNHKSGLAIAFERMLLEERKCTNERRRKRSESGGIASKETQPRILTEPVTKSTAEVYPVRYACPRDRA
jgi:hypothetical protein